MMQLNFLTIRYNGWKMEVNDDSAVLTNGGERVEIRKTGSFEKSLKLAKNKVNRLNKESK